MSTRSRASARFKRIAAEHSSNEAGATPQRLEPADIDAARD